MPDTTIATTIVALAQQGVGSSRVSTMAARSVALLAAFVGLTAAQSFPPPLPPTTADFTVYPESTFFCDGAVAVSFNGTRVQCGTEIAQAPAQAIYPTIQWGGASPTSMYAIVLVDRDAPNAITPNSSPIRHGAAVNVTGAELIRGVSNNATGTWLTSYRGPRPPPGSGCAARLPVIASNIVWTICVRRVSNFRSHLLI